MKRQRGFTLLEIVVSMTLTAMLLGLLSAGLYGVVNDWQREGNGLDRELDKSLVVLQIDRALQAAFPHTYVDPKRLARYVYFEADEKSLSFVSAVSPQRENGLMAWQLLTDVKEGVRIKQTPAFSDNPTERFAAMESLELLKDYTATWEFLVQKNPETKEWVKTWTGRERQSLPIAVHLTLTPRDSRDDAQSLDIVAQLRAWRNPDIQPVTTVN